MTLPNCETKSLKIPPARDEIEVSLFGPGYGESIVIHIGDNNWIIIDSCIDYISKKPLALEYLNKINVIPAKDVKQVIITHWHDDHIKGIAEIVGECCSADVICSEAMNSEEFLRIINAYRNDPMTLSKMGAGIDEMAKVFSILMEKHQKARCAIADRLLLRHPRGHGQCEIYSLSPSDFSVGLLKSMLEIIFPSEHTQKNRIPEIKPNYSAVVLWINTANFSILLGADLENTLDPRTGWISILDSPTRPLGKADVFKIPHHGSNNADEPRVWKEMLDTNPYSILTPFALGRHLLPSAQDVIRILANTQNAFSTATVHLRRSPARPQAVERSIREVTRYIRQIHHSSGQIRLRRKYTVNSSWQIELFDGALALS